MRECSRNSPTMLVTVIWSVLPGTPGTRQQMPRTIRSTHSCLGLRQLVDQLPLRDGVGLQDNPPPVAPGDLPVDEP